MCKIEHLYQLGRTIFSIDDLRLIWKEQNANALKASVKYFVDRGRLFRLRKGIYSLGADYDPLELGQKLINPSYISLETALQKHGVIFQETSSVTLCARYSRTLKVHGRIYQYHAMKDYILLNPLGIMHEKHLAIASPERAIGDWFYLWGEADFDNLRFVDAVLLKKIAGIYQQKTTKKFINKLIKNL